MYYLGYITGSIVPVYVWSTALKIEKSKFVLAKHILQPHVQSPTESRISSSCLVETQLRSIGVLVESLIRLQESINHDEKSVA